MNQRDYQKNRIYLYVGEDFRWFGLSLGEVAIVLCWFASLFLLEENLHQAVATGLMIFSMVSLKKFKKHLKGSSVRAFLYWHLGVRFGMGKFVPCSSKRLWVG